MDKKNKKPNTFTMFMDVLLILMVSGFSGIGYREMTGFTNFSMFFTGIVGGYLTILTLKYYELKYKKGK